MRLNFLCYSLRGFDGYGRYSAYLIRALRRAGVEVIPHFVGAADAPSWLLQEWGIDWNVPTISCMPPYCLRKLPRGHAPHWLLSMTEGSDLPDGWADIINEVGIDHIVVPCQHNAIAFGQGTHAPVGVVPGGTDPDDFPLRVVPDTFDKPYTFLALGDRGSRKGWHEVYSAFYAAFGGKSDGVQDVRLIVKYRPHGNDLIDMIRKGADLDPRIVWQEEDAANIADVYARADCFVIPSRCEGWGMPHREAATMGLPVITQAYSGMDDGHTHEWALVVEKGHLQPIGATPAGHIKGNWRIVDRDELADKMRACYDNPHSIAARGTDAALWLRKHQTWWHSSRALIALLRSEGVLEPERVYA